jgi:hypothetical protein
LPQAISHPAFDVVQGKGKDELAKLDPADIQVVLKRDGAEDITYKYKKEANEGAYLFGSSAHDYVFRVAEASIAPTAQASRSKLVQAKPKPEAPQASHDGQTQGSGG